MNTPSNALSEPFSSKGVVSGGLSATRPLYWSVRRELWENRSIYIAPLAVAAVILFAFAVGLTPLPHKLHGVSALCSGQEHENVDPYEFAALLLMGTTFITAVFYCLDALYGERRDRSVLFWKSLPVSDLTTVLAKASIPLFILPLLTFAITVAVQFVMLLMTSAVLLVKGQSVTALWAQVSLFQMSLMLLYHLLAVHGLWYAPMYGWLLLVSAWARRAVFLWAFLPPVAVGIIEKIVFNTSHFAALLQSRFSGGGVDALTAPDTIPIDPLMTHPTPGKFLSSAGLWIGLALTTAFLAAAVRLRRNRGPI